jgi:hypothetical protein
VIADYYLAEPTPAGLRPVEFDFAAAAAAEDALRNAAEVVHRGATLRAHDTADAVRDWSGGQRAVFDHTEHAGAQTAAALVRELQHYAEELRDAAARARMENAARSGRRADWHREQQARMAYARGALSAGRG